MKWLLTAAILCFGLLFIADCEAGKKQKVKVKKVSGPVCVKVARPCC